MKSLLDEELEFWGLSMNKFERWFFNRILAKQVRQGYSHDLRIMELYSMIRRACDAEFTEDNVMTRDAHLRELFEHTQYSPRST
jgi:hypothetical protein